MFMSSLSQSHHYKRKSITNRETPQINLANLISSTLILFVDFDYLLTIISLQQALYYFQLTPTPSNIHHPPIPHAKLPVTSTNLQDSMMTAYCRRFKTNPFTSFLVTTGDWPICFIRATVWFVILLSVQGAGTTSTNGT